MFLLNLFNQTDKEIHHSKQVVSYGHWTKQLTDGYLLKVFLTPFHIFFLEKGQKKRIQNPR